MREPKEILINGKTLEKILENHKHWLNKDIDGWENMYAYLRGADLSDANLRGVDLSGANLRYADLSDADLSRSDFKKMLVKQFAGCETQEDDAKEMNGWNYCRAKIIDILDRQPTLEIVRCKDYKHGDYCGENMFICEFHGCQIADFYCADGKMYD